GFMYTFSASSVTASPDHPLNHMSSKNASVQTESADPAVNPNVYHSPSPSVGADGGDFDRWFDLDSAWRPPSRNSTHPARTTEENFSSFFGDAFTASPIPIMQALPNVDRPTTSSTEQPSTSLTEGPRSQQLDLSDMRERHMARLEAIRALLISLGI